MGVVLAHAQCVLGGRGCFAKVQIAASNKQNKQCGSCFAIQVCKEGLTMTSTSIILQCAAVALLLVVVAEFHGGEATHLSRLVNYILI